MSAQAAVILTDGAATPVNRSFAPDGVDEKRVAWWRYVADGTVAGFNWLSQFVRDPVPQSDEYRVHYKLEIPILETVSSTGTSAGYTASPRVAYTLVADLDLRLPSRSSTLDRTNLQKMLLDLVNEGVFTDSVINLERAW